MTRGILIIGNESSLFSAAAGEALKRVESFASAYIPNRFPLPEAGVVPTSTVSPETQPATRAIPLSWNPSSPISARTLIVAAENRLKKINDAIAICSPPALFKTAEALTPEEIEIIVNDHIRGWFYLIRELVLYFRRAGSGSLSFLAPEIVSGGESTWGVSSGNRNIPVDFVGLSALASFRAFAQGVLTAHIAEPFQVMGFTGAEAGKEVDFSAWFFKLIDESAKKNSGRWHKFSRIKFFR